MIHNEAYKAGLIDGEAIGMDKLAQCVQDRLQALANMNQPLQYSDIIQCLNEALG